MTGLRKMIDIYERLEALEKEVMGTELTCDEAKEWAAKMKNSDGTDGAHWTISQTSDVAERIGVKFEHIRDYEWWVTMNMIYSDYYAAAKHNGVDSAEFYGDMAKAFLFDEDGGAPSRKLAEYYHSIAEG